MAKPRRDAMISELQRRTAEYYEDAEHTAMDYVTAWIERGRTITALAQSLTESVTGRPGIAPGVEITRHMIDRYVRSVVGEEQATALLTSSRKAGAHALVEEGLQTLDDSSDERDSLNANKVRLEARERLAATWNREDFAKASGPNVLISFAGLHLDALRQRATVTASATIADDAEVPLLVAG